MMVRALHGEPSGRAFHIPGSMNDNSDSSARRSIPYGRWAGLTALLVAELITISLRYDAATVPESRPWRGLVTNGGVVSRIGVAIALAVLLLAAPVWYRELMQSLRRLGRSRRSFAWMLANLVAFLCFFVLCVPVLEGQRSPGPADWLIFAAWSASGTATLVFWAMAILPGHLWIRLVRQSWGSILAGGVLGFGAYAAGLLARDQWKLLSKATLQLVHGMLSLVFTDVVYKPDVNLLGTSRFDVDVAPVCSGYEGMGLMAGLLAVALWTLRRDFRFPRAFALLPLAVALMWLANAFRIAALIALGTWGYPEVAVGGFHSLAGWILFLIVGLGLLACAHRLPFFSSVTTEPQNSGAAYDAAYLVPAMTLIATSMFTATFSPGLDRYYAVRVVMVAIAFAVYRKYYAELRLKWSWQAVGIGCVVFAFWMTLETFRTTASNGSPILSGPKSLPQGWSITWVIFRVFGSVIMVPLAEELAFRGYLTRRLISSDFRAVSPGRMTWISFLVSSVLFGLMHDRWVAGTLAGMAYALAYRRRGELADAVLAHGVTNGLIAAAVLATGAWSLWA
jgi:exosortase E/protease (VPEID-CTERM system)